MNISGCAPCFPSASHCLPMYPVAEPVGSGSSLDQSHSSSILCNLSILKDKVHEVQSLVSILISPGQSHLESTSLAIASMGSLVQDIILTASSMLVICQQMSLGATSGNNIDTVNIPDNRVCQPPDFGDNSVGNIVQDPKGQSFYSSSETISWYCDRKEPVELPRKSEISEGSTQPISSAKNYDIIELDAADLLAKYTHYCQFCGKGFKRDANLRMHMRAHGDEYKSTAALINPMKNVHHAAAVGNGSMKMGDQKYSCPQEGCRWNQKHAKFTPLKSMICVKNHYKRSHCPKMYVCKRCNRKQFSVLSDLKTHEKHCGDLKWQCSCGTTFSRKDKLMGHVALFVGHSPLVVTNSMAKPG